jgi:hypothetical protein
MQLHGAMVVAGSGQRHQQESGKKKAAWYVSHPHSD